MAEKMISDIPEMQNSIPIVSGLLPKTLATILIRFSLDKYQGLLSFLTTLIALFRSPITQQIWQNVGADFMRL